MSKRPSSSCIDNSAKKNSVSFKQEYSTEIYVSLFFSKNLPDSQFYMLAAMHTLTHITKNKSYNNDNVHQC